MVDANRIDVIGPSKRDVHSLTNTVCSCCTLFHVLHDGLLETPGYVVCAWIANCREGILQMEAPQPPEATIPLSRVLKH